MGSNWVRIRDSVREGTLSRRTAGLDDVAARWDQLIRFSALKLSAEIGEDVNPVFPRGQEKLEQRSAAVIESLSDAGTGQTG